MHEANIACGSVCDADMPSLSHRPPPLQLTYASSLADSSTPINSGSSVLALTRAATLHRGVSPVARVNSGIKGGSNRSLPASRTMALSRSHVGSSSQTAAHHSTHHTHGAPLPSGLRKVNNTYAVLQGSKQPPVVSLTLAHNPALGSNPFGESVVSLGGGAWYKGEADPLGHRGDPVLDVSSCALVSAAVTDLDPARPETQPVVAHKQPSEALLVSPPSPIANLSTVDHKKKKGRKRSSLSFLACLFCVPVASSMELSDGNERSPTGEGATARSRSATGTGPAALTSITATHKPLVSPISLQAARGGGAASAAPAAAAAAADATQPVPAATPLRHNPCSALSSTLSGGGSSFTDTLTSPNFAQFLNVSTSGPLQVPPGEGSGTTSLHAVTSPTTPHLLQPSPAAPSLAAAVAAQQAAVPHEDQDAVMMRSLDTSSSLNEHRPHSSNGQHSLPAHDSNPSKRSVSSGPTSSHPQPVPPPSASLSDILDRERAGSDLTFGEMLVQLQAIIENDIAAHAGPPGSTAPQQRRQQSGAAPSHTTPGVGLLAHPFFHTGAVALSSTTTVPSPTGSRPLSRTSLLVAGDDSTAARHSRRLQLSRSSRSIRGLLSPPAVAVRAAARHISVLDGRRGGARGSGPGARAAPPALLRLAVLVRRTGKEGASWVGSSSQRPPRVADD
ncbi:MAG: hypothetical protein WDW38_005951 [Sanguina aurantia]